MNFKTLTLITGIFLSQSALALPTLYPLKETLLSTIVNETNSNLIADSEDSRVFYVMPPNSAISKVGSLHSITSNIGFCREMRDLQGYSRQTVEKIAKLSSVAEERLKLYEGKNQEVKEAKLKLADYVVANGMKDLVDLDDRIDENDMQIKKVLEQIENCTQYCSQLNIEYKELRKIRQELRSKRMELAEKYDERMQKYVKLEKRVEALTDDLQAARDNWSNLRDELLNVHDKYFQMYRKYGEMPGAQASISFSSIWDENINRLKSQNPGFDFKKIQTQNAVLTSNIMDVKDIPTAGGIISYKIGGETENGKLTLTSYPEHLSGNILLSLIGACPVLHPDYFDVNLPNGTDQMRYGLTVSYEYPSAFTAKLKASYSMYKMYKKVVSSGSKGGFFRRKSWTSVEERTFFKDSFEVEWLEQDEANPLSEEQKADLEREMRNNIFARLAAIGLPAAANAGQLVLPPVGPSGAIVLSGSLKKYCPGNAYCIAGSVALDVLDSIFGSSSASASYTNIQETTQYETWSKTSVSYRPWVTTYN